MCFSLQNKMKTHSPSETDRNIMHLGSGAQPLILEIKNV